MMPWQLLLQQAGLSERTIYLMCRYALLYTFGGFYMDLDIECHKPLDALRAYPFIMPQTRPVGFSNDFLASTAGVQLTFSTHPAC